MWEVEERSLRFSLVSQLFAERIGHRLIVSLNHGFKANCRTVCKSPCNQLSLIKSYSLTSYDSENGKKVKTGNAS